MSVLVFNAGSSSLKFGLFDNTVRTTLASGSLDWSGGNDVGQICIRSGDNSEYRRKAKLIDTASATAEALSSLVDADVVSLKEINAVGHRVVHGGTRFQHAVVIDAAVRSAIAELADLAPLHNPVALQTIEAAEAALPNAPHFAAFDTAFFATLPPAAHIYPIPYDWFTDWGIRRFGFHGISHQYCANRAAQLLGRAELRMVICHLGNGCSASAVRNGQPLATTMGFSPMEGLMMGSRAGSIDPGILLWVQRRKGLRPEQLDDILNHQAGLLGISGISSDYRQVEGAASRGNARAALALEIYTDRLCASIGALTASLGGIDALVFTGGVGENARQLRSHVCASLGFLGLALDHSKNENCADDADIGTPSSSTRVIVIRTREELMIARSVVELLVTA